jgi:hypothetical protein
MTDTDTFTENIKAYATIDAKIKSFNEELKELRSTKNELTNSIYEYVNEANLEGHSVAVGNNKLKFSKTRVVAPLTLKYIETCLGELIEETDTINSIMNYIKEKREVKYVNAIKKLKIKSSNTNDSDEE